MVLASLGMDTGSGWCNHPGYVGFSNRNVPSAAGGRFAACVSWWPRAGVGQAPESVLSGEGRIEVVSPAGVATFEGELRAPW